MINNKHRPIQSPNKVKNKKEIEAYWTEERMKNAKPIPLPMLAPENVDMERQIRKEKNNGKQQE
ncbi:MAG: hypothetical protein KAX49_18450 [Halanaerobiales bacterium]|nr:hypothetical protein [Halanaerobiales bacterium]